ncbi:MAG: hypothetical protein BWZ03_00344 [bacterium ADurb.BinA186]|nr:MAG: hypothetical protein BWZ03_00344 [bacterium ADurb.BinA186]
MDKFEKSPLSFLYPISADFTNAKIYDFERKKYIPITQQTFSESKSITMQPDSRPPLIIRIFQEVGRIIEDYEGSIHR